MRKKIPTTQHVFIRRKATGGFCQSAPLLEAGELHSRCADDSLGNIFLHGEDIDDLGTICLGPDLPLGRGLGQPHGVAGQVARDAAGDVVGESDLGAQIEQVGKNVGACLDGGGATVKDIVFTVSYVTQPAEFERYADLRRRYFGAPSPKSATVAVPQLAGPDLLMQVGRCRDQVAGDGAGGQQRQRIQLTIGSSR